MTELIAQQELSSLEPVGVGIVGAGLIGRKRAFALPANASLIQVHDIDPQAGGSLARDCGCAASSSLDELMSDDKITLVIVATTHDQLAGAVSRALEAGKHVLVEKPAGVSLYELEPLRQQAADSALRVRVGFNHRFHPALLQAKGIIESSDLGRLLWIRGRYGHGGRVGYEREWRAIRARSGGGELIDQGSHLIDLVRFLVGDADLAYAHLPTLFWAMEVEDNAFIALKPRSGGFAWLHASWSEWKNLFSFEVTFERAKIEINGLGGSYGTERLTFYGMSPEMGPPATTAWEYPFQDTSWAAEMADVVSTITSGKGVGASIDDAIEVMRIIEGAYTS